MRLNNYNSNRNSSVGDPEGPSADLVEHILQTSEKKRSRPTSSLDIKVENGSKMTTPPSKAEKKQTTRTPPREQQQQQQQRRMTHNTRARRGRLPSQKKYDAMMDDEDMLQVLYEDPELLASAKASEQTKKPNEKKPFKKGKSLNKYPDHIKSQMEEGVPVTQWIVVLVLLGAGFYQLRKSLAGPSTAGATAKSGSRKVTERGMGRKNGKLKGKKNTGKSKGKAKPRSTPVANQDRSSANAISPIEETIIPEREQEPPAEKKKTTGATKKSAAKKRSRKQKSAKKASAVTTGAQNEATHESPDSVSTDGSSSAEAAPQNEEDRMANLVEDSQLRPEDMKVDSEGWQSLKHAEDDGWQTVRGGGDKTRKKPGLKKNGAQLKEKPPSTDNTEAAPPSDYQVASVEKKETPVEKPESEAAKPADLNKKEQKEETGESAVSTTGTIEVEGSSQSETQPDSAAAGDISVPVSVSQADAKTPANGNRKKKSKKKKKQVPVTKETNNSVTQDNGKNDTNDDAALALRLQQEEEKFASSPPSPVEEVWEEVSNKKRKSSSAPAIEA